MADVEAGSLAAARDQVTAVGGEVIDVPTDVTKEDQVFALADTAWERSARSRCLQQRWRAHPGRYIGCGRKDWNDSG